MAVKPLRSKKKVAGKRPTTKKRNAAPVKLRQVKAKYQRKPPVLKTNPNTQKVILCKGCKNVVDHVVHAVRKNPKFKRKVLITPKSVLKKQADAYFKSLGDSIYDTYL